MPAGRPLFLTGLLLLSINLRPAAVSIGPVLAEVRDGVGLSAAEASLLTSLPVLAFAVFGALAPRAAGRIGAHRVTLAALLAAFVGLVGRAATGSDLIFLALSLVALAGMAMANVLLPSLVKRHEPLRVGAVTAWYTTALAVGQTAALVLTVPVADALGSWRWGLAVWALPAALALAPWAVLAREDAEPREPSAAAVGVGRVLRTPLGVAMAVFFGLQALQAYAVVGWFAQLWRDAGWSPTAAGVLVGATAGLSIPLSLWLPRRLAASRRPARVLAAVIACYPAGYALIAVDARTLAVPGTVLVGVALCTFPLILTLVGLRARTAEGTAALSASTQSVGYLLAAVGPFTVGLLHAATGAWTVPLVLLLALSLPMLALAAYVARPAYVEDQLG